jgi:ADP-heptose:LPS heptosyltransferase
MQPTKLPSNAQWVIVTVNQPVMFHQLEDETWVFNPGRRYLMNAARIPMIHQYIESVSELEGAALYNRLLAGKSITGAKILIERFRERGIGDLLFLTGPLAFFNHVTGSRVTNHLYAFSDRGVVLRHSPFLHNGTVLCGPIEYDALRYYNYHWFVGSVTECDEESDQLNVYDALYKQLGFNPADIEPQWKRPRATLANEDFQHLDVLFKNIWDNRKVDLRRIGYYVAAPFSNATLRCMNYSTWLDIIKELSTRRPVVVVGQSHWKLPDMDMSAGQFIEKFSTLSQGVISAVDCTPLRVLMALIARSTGVFCMDSGPLYMAQALNVPAVSFWGSHAPGMRIGYDRDLMELAVWHEADCQQAPCCAYSQFPPHKCPRGQHQTICECLATITVEDVLKKVDKIESNRTAHLKA